MLYPASLKKHALLVSVSSILLSILLGSRAYRVASTHSTQITNLVNREIPAEALLVQMEGHANSIDQAQKKLHITKDAMYEQVMKLHMKALSQTREELVKTL